MISNPEHIDNPPSSKIVSALLSAWRVLWKILLFFIAWGLLIAFSIVPFKSKLDDWSLSSPIETQMYYDVASLVTVLIATWLMTRFIDRRSLSSVGFSRRHIVSDSLSGVFIGTLWLVTSVVIVWIPGWARAEAPVGFSWPVLLAAAASMLFNVVAQELLLCGYILQSIRKESNAVVAAIISSALFSCYHAGAFHGQFLPVVNVFAAGMVFCLAYFLTGNLWFPIAIHFSWDVLLGPVLGMTESGKSGFGENWTMFAMNGPPLFTGGRFGLEGGLVVTFTAVAAVVAVYYWKHEKRPAEPYRA